MAIKSLNFYLLTFFFPILCTCSDREPAERLRDYGLDCDLSGKTLLFKYIDVSDGDSMFVEKKCANANGQKILEEFWYSNSQNYSLRTYSITEGGKELVAEKVYEEDRNGQEFPVDTEIVTYRNVGAGKYKALETILAYDEKFSIHRVKLRSFEEYSNDTVFFWQESTLPTLKFNYTYSYSYFPKYLPFMGSKSSSTGSSYYSKGIGLSRYFLVDEDGNKVDLVLVDIKII